MPAMARWSSKATLIARRLAARRDCSSSAVSGQRIRAELRRCRAARRIAAR